MKATIGTMVDDSVGIDDESARAARRRDQPWRGPGSGDARSWPPRDLGRARDGRRPGRAGVVRIVPTAAALAMLSLLASCSWLGLGECSRYEVTIEPDPRLPLQNTDITVAVMLLADEAEFRKHTQNAAARAQLFRSNEWREGLERRNAVQYVTLPGGVQERQPVKVTFDADDVPADHRRFIGVVSNLPGDADGAVTVPVTEECSYRARIAGNGDVTVPRKDG